MPQSLDNAPNHIKLAVDLIYLLESNEVDPQTALAALQIVTQDLKGKMNNGGANDTNEPS